jgi:uncharacterized protein involved in exopolysaccharide biosynthesis
MDQTNSLLRFDRVSPPLIAHRAEHGITIGDVLQRVLAHGWLISACGLVCLALSWGYVLHRPPSYEASAILRFDPDRAGSLGVGEQGAQPSAASGDGIPTELVIFKSDGVAIRAINALTDSEFLRFAGVPRTGGPIPEQGEVLNPDQQKLVDKLQKQLTVKQMEGTQLISVAVKDKDPQIAAILDNNIVKAYERQGFDSRAQAVSQLRTWLSAQMNDLKDQVNASQKALAGFEQANHVIGTAGTSNTIADRLHFLSEQLSTAQAARIAKEAEMRSAQVATPNELASLLPNPRLSTLETAQGTCMHSTRSCPRSLDRSILRSRISPAR